ncbi:MAG TPA: DsbA family protein [Ferruginibacter sp.]|nr:DsbA family protein [Ferruginibacter sp.]
MKKHVLFYCYDAYCGWCYGFSPVMKKIAEQYKNEFDIEVLSGGMIIGDEVQPIDRIAGYIRTAYKRVEDLSGIKFGEDFLWHINNPDKSDWQMNSEKPAIALCVFKEYYPEQQLAFASDLQYALNYEGRDLDDNEAYRHLLEKYKIPEDTFYEQLKNPEFKDRAYYEFSLCKQLQVNGFPCVLLQVDEAKFYLVSKGFTDYETMNERLKNIVHELEVL